MTGIPLAKRDLETVAALVGEHTVCCSGARIRALCDDCKALAIEARRRASPLCCPSSKCGMCG